MLYTIKPTGYDIDAVNTVLGLPEYQYLDLLVQCVSASLAVGLQYPVTEASQLNAFLEAISHGGDASFQELYTWVLPLVDKNDFIQKIRVAAQEWLVLQVGTMPATKLHQP